MMGINTCPLCFDKQRRIDELEDELKRLKRKLRTRERKDEDGFFGSSTPSSKKPVKANTIKQEKKPVGARAGHKGNGRRSHEAQSADHIVDVAPESELCPVCAIVLQKKGTQERSILDTLSAKPQKILYRLAKRYCPHCRKTYTPSPPGVLPKSLYGNQLIANAVVMYYLNGLPMGRICQDLGISDGALTEVFHRVSRLFEGVSDKLIQEYRQAPVKHADETSWRTNGRNGYAWLFATPDMSIFQFGKNRSSKVPQAVFGKKRLPGVLVVDRYAAYNKVPCHLQYCYAHLLRDVQDLEKEFPDESEIATFTAVVAPLLSLAMGLRRQELKDDEFYAGAARLRSDIKAAMAKPAKHAGIRRIQDIFTEHESRMFHWADNRAVPADNNLAERDLRPSVIARKVSFGSVTDAGAEVRSAFTTIVTTLRKRGLDPARQLKTALDALSDHPEKDPFPILFPRAGPNDNDADHPNHTKNNPITPGYSPVTS
jgi:transposase